MPVVEESVVIALPQQDVFDFLAQFENLSVYDAFVTGSGQVGDGPPGLGTRGWGTTRFMGQQFDWVVEFTEFEPPRRMMSRSVGGGRDLTATFTLEPAGAARGAVGPRGCVRADRRPIRCYGTRNTAMIFLTGRYARSSVIPRSVTS